MAKRPEVGRNVPTMAVNGKRADKCRLQCFGIKLCFSVSSNSESHSATTDSRLLENSINSYSLGALTYNICCQLTSIA